MTECPVAEPDLCSEPLLPMILVGNGITGGMEEYVLSLLREFRRRGQRALVSAPFLGEFTNTLLEQGHPAEDFYVFDMPRHEINFRALAHLATILRARNVSLVHSHLLPADILGGAAAAAAGIPHLSTLHGTVHNLEEVLLHDFAGTEYITVSRAGQASAIESGLPLACVRYVPNGVHLENLEAERHDRHAVRAQLDVAAHQLLVLSVARLSPEKNPRGLVEAAMLAAAADERLVFALAGTGCEEPEIRRRLADHPLGSRVRVLGLRGDVPALLSAADIFALASSTESLPFAVMEAMAMRRPPVCFEVGGLAELVESGISGFLVPFGDTRLFADRLLQLFCDPNLRESMGEAARSTILERHDFADAAAATLRAYHELVERTRRREAVALQNDFRPPPPPAAPAPDLPVLDALGIAVVDSHVHLSGGESAGEVIDIFDSSGIHAACLIGPFINTERWEPLQGDALRRSNHQLLDLVAQRPERLWGLVTVDPRSPGAARDLGELAGQTGVHGVKLIPHGWAPDGPEARDTLAACAELRLPILFHSGIFIGGRTSDFCRPARYETVRDFPGLRVVLAHLGWPWTDEAIAVAFMDVLKGWGPQISLDTSPGTPPLYRREALRKALHTLGSGPLLWGCDRFLPIDPGVIRGLRDDDAAMLHELGASDDDLHRIFADNATELFGASRTRRVAVAEEAAD